jgi:DNA polymerase I-like protein with 3'-5' exonuclease and polymerase domains/uracil-DNA glycosylase
VNEIEDDQAEVKAETKAVSPRITFKLPDGRQLTFKEKRIKDILKYRYPPDKNHVVTVPDAYKPIIPGEFKPGLGNPLCTLCKLDDTKPVHPYLQYAGADKPLVTIIVESVGKKEDIAGEIGAGGTNSWLASLIHNLRDRHGIKQKDIRWVPMTRCANCSGLKVNYKTKGNWCRHFVIQDLLLHPPKVIIPVGTNVLGLLSHKSNAQDWSGRLLTWRGWPDDWLSEPKFMLPRADPLYPTDTSKTAIGHPLYGLPPNIRIPMMPVQSPLIIKSFANDKLFERWQNDLVRALNVATKEIQVPNYDRPWYKISTDHKEIIGILSTVISYAQANHDFIISFDTETTGLKQWAHWQRQPGGFERSADPKIVFMMFRWTNPETGLPQSIGFPWDYPESPLLPYLPEIKPYALNLLKTASVAGHNLTFDALFAIATIGQTKTACQPFTTDGKWNKRWSEYQQLIRDIADHSTWDTWHMAFTLLQRRGSLGLELLTYEYLPELAGYEEDMTLLINLHTTMQPQEGGHYANCPPDKWETHLKPYVMGDAETTYCIREKLADHLGRKQQYDIPLADPNQRGKFRLFKCQDRTWIYKNIVSPASRTLIKMMARGMYVDPDELLCQEQNMPEAVKDAKNQLIEANKENEKLNEWFQKKISESKPSNEEATGKKIEWELDLENKTDLKEILFTKLGCDIKRLTKKGQEAFPGQDPETIAKADKLPFAAVDKYTLNQLCVDNPKLRPLLEYRRIYKIYTTYVRPMRNITTQVDKKDRKKAAHLSVDGCIHTQFMMTGTRGGRLSSRDPNLQNLPRKGSIKKLFTSRFGKRGCIYGADLSQIELRLMAALSGDPIMVQAYWDDVDIHSLTASKVFGIPYETFTKAHMEDLEKHGRADEAKELSLKRVVAKTTNFLTGYGGGAFGLQNVLANNEVYKSLEECEKIVFSFFDVYAVLKRFLGRYKRFINETTVAVSVFGRVRYFEEINSNDQEQASRALRAGCNHVIQSTASDMMLICLIAIEGMMAQEKLRSLLVSTVHDSLVIDALRDELPQVHEIIDFVLNNIPMVINTLLPDFDTSWMIVPFAGDSSVGVSYGQQMSIGKNPDWHELLDRSETSK